MADIGHILATSDKEMSEKDPVPRGGSELIVRRPSIRALFAPNAGRSYMSIQPKDRISAPVEFSAISHRCEERPNP